MTALPLLAVSYFRYARIGIFMLKEVSFDLHAGQALVVMGPNGSGKTTLLRCLAGIPDAFPNITKTASQAYIGHLNALKKDWTVTQNLLFQTGATSVDVTSALAEMKLEALGDRPVGTLSAGQRRQVALTRLPLSKAVLWLMDEPTAHLDAGAITRFWKGLEAHLKGGGAAVLTSHIPIPLSQTKVINLHG